MYQAPSARIYAGKPCAYSQSSLHIDEQNCALSVTHLSSGMVMSPKQATAHPCLGRPLSCPSITWPHNVASLRRARVIWRERKSAQ